LHGIIDERRFEEVQDLGRHQPTRNVEFRNDVQVVLIISAARRSCGVDRHSYLRVKAKDLSSQGAAVTLDISPHCTITVVGFSEKTRRQLDVDRYVSENSIERVEKRINRASFPE
jgi:hypothetical protein